MARESRYQSLWVGLVVLAALAVFAVAMLVIGQETQLFVPKLTFRTNFADASGLRVGSPVTMAGVRVGSVRRIILPTDPTSQGIEVVMTVNREYAARVREGTTAQLVFLQMVANEKAVDLTPGDPEGKVLPPGSFIPPAEVEPILETGRTIADTLEEITADLREILGAMRRGEGLLGKAIVDPEFGNETLTRLNTVLASMNDVLLRMQRGEGLVARLLADEQYGRDVTARLSELLEAAGRIVEGIEQGRGALGRLAAEGEAEQMVDDLSAAAASIRRLGERLDERRGLVERLVADEELADRLARNVDETMARLASITRKIDEGEGTLGLLVNEPTLYDDVEQLITGMRRSRLVSWLLRRYHRKGGQREAGSGS
ncbi:MAG: MCE family protein [Acidobacteria bacterium]|nr:MAG: MCE family protein [Acidobacteriota bacterium]